MDPFHAYDIRGRYPKDINEEFAYKLGRATASTLKPTSFIVAWDARTKGEDLAEHVIEGLRKQGVSVVSIGLSSTPEFYYTLISSYADGGIMVTASHNPREYNGFKICERKGKPVFKENKLPEIKQRLEEENYEEITSSKGKILKENVQEKYTEHFKKITRPLTKKFRILADTGNGMGIRDIRRLQEYFGENVEIETLFEDIKGNFPFHQPDPTKEENTKVLRQRLEDQEGQWDFGCAFDGDADRIIFFNRKGEMIPPDYITGLIGGYIGQVHDLVGYEVRTSRSVNEYLEAKGINTRRYPAGSTYMKLNGSEDNAIFLGEKSGHYMYKTLHYTDSPLLTIITLLKHLDLERKTLEEAIAPLNKYVQSGEINYGVLDKDKALERLKKSFEELGEEFRIEEIDGVSVYADEFFFNVRKSNTEELLRVNIEGDSKEVIELIKKKIEENILPKEEEQEKGRIEEEQEQEKDRN